MFQTTSLGKTVYQVNDPELALIVFTESEWFTKEINDSHPLCPMKDDKAGVFLSDTDTEAWRVVHKFVPPALGPKAVRHYAPVSEQIRTTTRTSPLVPTVELNPPTANKWTTTSFPAEKRYFD